MIYNRFEQCLKILKVYELPAVQFTKESLIAQKDELLKEKERVSVDVRKTIRNASVSNASREARISIIENQELISLRNTLYEQQRNNIYADAKKLTIAKIVMKRKELEQLNNSVRENSLRVEQIKKMLMSIILEIDKIEDEVKLMDECVLVNTFLNEQALHPAAIPEYDFKRLYKTYMEKK